MIMKILCMIALMQLFMMQSFAKNIILDIEPEEELQILESLDINQAFLEDPLYKKMKKDINQLKTIYFLKTLKRGKIFIPNLQELLDESDVPNTFLYMAMVESKFLADSKSHRHAAGLWQFMPATAREYNLTRNSHLDERLDPIKSTKAAIEYLKYLYDRFGKWYLAAMAYNCGEGRLSKAIKKAGTDDLSTLLNRKKEYLPKETRDYIRRILVAALLAQDKNIIEQNDYNHLYGFCSNKKLEKLFFKGGESLYSISLKIKVPLKKIKACNPHLIKNRLPPNKKIFYIYLPDDLAKEAKEAIKSSKETFTYIVKENDTLFQISKRFNIKMNTIKILNPHLKKILKIGTRLTLLGKDPDHKRQEEIKKAKIIKNRTYLYKLEENLSLYEISLKFNNKISTLKELNPNIPDNLQKGMKIVVVKDVEINSTKNSKPIKFATKALTKETNRSKDALDITIKKYAVKFKNDMKENLKDGNAIIMTDKTQSKNPMEKKSYEANASKQQNSKTIQKQTPRVVN